MYEPLPKGIRVLKSPISGQGLFTLIFLKKDTDLGMSHIVLNHDPKENDDELIRTPLGGHINHSDDPNCIKIKKGNRYNLKTIKDVVGGDELTVKYTFYNIEKEIQYDEWLEAKKNKTDLKTESEKMQNELEPLPFCPMADD